MVLKVLANWCEIVNFDFRQNRQVVSVSGVAKKIPLQRNIIREILEYAKLCGVKICEIHTEVGLLSYGLP